MARKMKKKWISISAFIKKHASLLIYCSFLSYLLAFICYIAAGFITSERLSGCCFLLLVIFLSAGAFLSGIVNLLSLFRMSSLEINDCGDDEDDQRSQGNDLDA